MHLRLAKTISSSASFLLIFLIAACQQQDSILQENASGTQSVSSASNDAGNGADIIWPNAATWPLTNFDKFSVTPDEFVVTGLDKDGIPSIDAPKFISVDTSEYDKREPVIALTVDNISRAYPLSVLMWHEIVNDVIAEKPVVVTYCPLCNSALVYERIIDGNTTTFGVSDVLRKSSLVMYDRETESWWQQVTGEAIVGERTGHKLTRLPARFISVEQFQDSFPQGKILARPDTNFRYGENKFVDFDSTGRPFKLFVEVPEGFDKMERVVMVDNVAWRLKTVADAGEILEDGLRIKWSSGQVSAVDNREISKSRDVGSIIVERKNDDGEWELANYDVVFAFVFAAFKPDGEWRG